MKWGVTGEKPGCSDSGPYRWDVWQRVRRDHDSFTDGRLTGLKFTMKAVRNF